ncbi:hypothetical protein MTO96_014114 [Rhipicephalus appendiculatus]
MWFKVTGLEAKYVGAGHALIEWVKSTGPVLGYDVITCTYLMPRHCERADVTETRLKLRDLRPDTTYIVKVRPFDDTLPVRLHGEQVSINFTTRSLPVVRGLRVLSTTATTMKLEWTPPDVPVKGYRVTSKHLISGLHDFNTTDHSVTLTDLIPEEEYEIEVETINEERGGTAYGTDVRVSARTTKLQPPSDVQVFPTCDRKVIASWNYSGDPITRFELLYCSGTNCIPMEALATERNASVADYPMQGDYTFTIHSRLNEVQHVVPE